ncbi:NUDIX hydrolase [Trypanosoma rangeli]|uniref:NUDIX hydrolase n=1 Tax=Trypanosoma rangeli TaxID=5698 RepID=A0A3R7N2P2_TRYRA|nr:NUDIX hydrolase [Trypanosoma rangeli]RNF11867.1 NUDIX hydrolase [Trypanosoma rangeli]|eukprot:RNF11867.1 NUDIX hydrolase [Trypanosoma rangeli]
MAAAGATHLLPRTTSEWVALVRRALHLRLDELEIPEHFFVKDIRTGRRYSHLQDPMRTPHQREGATLVLLSPPSKMTGRGFQEMCITLTKRTANVRCHKNQMSFPGGKVNHGESPVAAAQRETMEEVGIGASLYHVIGQLHPIYSLDSGYKVFPVVAVATTAVEPLCNSPDEVASIHYLHLSRLLLDSSRVHCRIIRRHALTRAAPALFPCFFASNSQTVACSDVCPTLNAPPIPEDGGLLPMLQEDFPGELVWGITSFATCEFLLRLAAVLALRKHSELQAMDLLRCSSVVARFPEGCKGVKG